MMIYFDRVDVGTDEATNGYIMNVLVRKTATETDPNLEAVKDYVEKRGGCFISSTHIVDKDQE